MAEELEFLVKNPSRPSQADFRLRLPAAATVRQLKLALQAGYPGSPDPASVTVSAMGWRGWAVERRLEGKAQVQAGAAGILPWPTRMPGASLLLPLPAALRQAIYAGRVLKDDGAVLGDFVVPVSGGAGRCWAGSVEQASAADTCAARGGRSALLQLLGTCCSLQLPTTTFSRSSTTPRPCRTWTPRCRSRCTL